MGVQNINIPPQKPSVRVSLNFLPPRLERQTNIEFRSLSQDNDIFTDLLEGITLFPNLTIETSFIVVSIPESLDDPIEPSEVELIAKASNYE